MKAPSPKADRLREMREAGRQKSLVNPRLMPSEREIKRIADKAGKTKRK